MTVNDRRAFGLDVKLRRKEFGWTQAQVARKARVTQARISQIENGTGTPSMSALFQVLEVLELRLGLLDTYGGVYLTAERRADSKVGGLREVLAEAVRTRRLELGLTQTQLAKMAGMKQPRISQIERGTGNTELETWSRVVMTLGIRLKFKEVGT